MAVWLSKHSCQKPLCLGEKVNALSWKRQKNRDEQHLVADSLQQLQLLLQETGSQKLTILSRGSHMGAVSLVPWTCPASKGCLQFKKQIKGSLLKMSTAGATYLAVKNILSTEARRHSRCPLQFCLIKGPFITLPLLTRGPLNSSLGSNFFLIAIFVIDATCNPRRVTWYTSTTSVWRG